MGKLKFPKRNIGLLGMGSFGKQRGTLAFFPSNFKFQFGPLGFHDDFAET
jgi:hypothetical protein